MAAKKRNTGQAVPQGVVSRLPIYYRYLAELESKKVERISSAQFGEAVDCTAAQIRSDLSYFGSFGQQGYGYNVSDLLTQLEKILGLHRTYSVLLVGAGNLGKALASYESFRARGFQIKAIFDVDPLLIGNYHSGTIIRPFSELSQYLRENRVELAIIATPKDATQEVADILVDGGVKSIWNFAPIHPAVPDDVLVENIHLTDSLLRLAFRMNEQENAENDGSV